MKINYTTPKIEFIKQYVLNRALGNSCGLSGESAFREATNAWVLIEKELKKEMEKLDED